MSIPEDTSKRDPHIHLAGAWDNPSRYIQEQEAAGQLLLVASSGDEEKLTGLGFTFGDKIDDLFREATLPEGWSKKGSDHDMWSYVVDETGAERVAVFYKAAFYDRCAFMRVQS